MSRAQRLVVVLTLNLALVAALVIAGIAAHSLGVLAEAGDYLVEAGAVAVALLALMLSRRRSAPAPAPATSTSPTWTRPSPTSPTTTRT